MHKKRKKIRKISARENNLTAIFGSGGFRIYVVKHKNGWAWHSNIAVPDSVRDALRLYCEMNLMNVIPLQTYIDNVIGDNNDNI